MMRLRWFVMFLVVFAMPVYAQDESLTTYEFDTGTTVEFPSAYEQELVDGILTLNNDDESQVLVLDYPLVDTLRQQNNEITLAIAVEALANLLLDMEIEPDEIYEFVLDDRVMVAYDIDFALSGAVYGVTFTNGAIGLLVTLEVDEEVETEILVSFDNEDNVRAETSVPAGRNSQARPEPSVFLFPTDQRFFIPAGWQLDVRQRDEFQYAVVSVPDTDVTAQVIDLSANVTKGTDLADAIDLAGFDWEVDFGVSISSDRPVDYALGDREALQYSVSVDGVDGFMVVLRYSDDAIGVVVVYGDDIQEYGSDITQLTGSFNNFGSVVGYLQ